jgi:ubiquinone/menaquinone biosynthesis C-methylase UbiE
MAPLVRAGFTVHGTDASLHMLYKNQHHDALLSHARAHRLPYDSCRFAMTYAIRLFSNFKTDVYAASVLLEMARVTREGGYILVGRMNSYRPKTTKIAIPRCFDGLKLVKRDSAMMFGIPMHVSCSEGLHPPLVFLDSIATRLLPRLANQQYYLYRKDYSHA